MVWTQDRRDIFTYNLENNEKSQVSTPRTGGIKYIPKISNDIIVWGDTRNTNNTRDGNSDIYAYNLSTGEEFQVTSNPYGQWAPDVSGNVIVWQDDRNGNLDIYGYNLDTKTEFQITTDEADQQQPRVSGDIVIWEDRRNDNYTPSLCPGPRCDRDPDAIRFYAYDLTTFTEFPLPFNSEAIGGELVVGRQNTPMGDRISVFNIRSQEKVASWIVPLNV